MSSQNRPLKAKVRRQLIRVAEKLGAPSGRVCIFLLSTLRSRASCGYTRALLVFSSEVPASWRERTPEKRDLWLSDYVLEKLEESVPPSRLRTLLAALQKIGVGKFRMPWRVLDGWASLSPPTQASAIPESVLRAFCSVCLLCREPVVATILVLCYYGVLRVSEALHLAPADVFFGPQQVVLYLARTKRGMEEVVVIEEAFVTRWMKWYMASGHATRKPGIFLPCSYGRIQRRLEFCQQFLNLAGERFTTHSCRRGGATRLYMQRVPLQDIALYGRWKSLRSCHEYLRKGEVYLARIRQSDADWELIDTFCWGIWRVWRASARNCCAAFQSVYKF